MSPLRNLPSVDRLVQAVQPTLPDAPRALVVQAARDELAQQRTVLLQPPTNGTPPPTLATLAQQVHQRVVRLLQPSLVPVINASGVIIQTNLGRAPLSAAALAAIQQVAGGYANLEYDLALGARGSRSVHSTSLLCQLSGAEAALVVNNNAAAVYLVLLAFAAGREVIVSRGQAVEIGGGFRIPDVLRQSGATLVEVGTTNRTYRRDYEAAITANTALLLRVHSSNFRLVGFVHETGLDELAALGRERGVPVLDDLGSGSLIDTTPYGIAPEPLVQQSVAAGADLVAFSGDKLLGGPQAGIIVGRANLIERLRTHPLARALRVDKLTIAALEATLLAYVRGTAQHEIPVWQMISAELPTLQERAARLQAQLQQQGIAAEIVPCASAVGGGSLPGETLPSIALRLSPAALGSRADLAAYTLRTGTPAVVARVAEDCLLCDLRSVLPQQDELLLLRLQQLGSPR